MSDDLEARRMLDGASAFDPISGEDRAQLCCPVYARCGGCPWITLEDERRRDMLLAELMRSLRAAGVELGAGNSPSWHRSPEPLAYRNRVRLRVGADGVPCFFNPEKARDCAVLSPSVRQGISLLSARACTEPSLLAPFVHLELRARDELGRWGLRCTPRAGTEPPAPELGAEWLTGVCTPASDAMPCQRWRVGDGCCIEVPLDAFLQVNLAVNRSLVAFVVGRLVASGARSFADLFMGSGNFALPLLASGLVGMGVERHAGAVVAARRVASAGGFDASALVAGDALVVAERWGAEGRRPDAVVCDPPRAGLGPAAPVVARLARRSIVLCSCLTDSACRDAARLVAEGFVLESVALFDMFPQTRHVEVVLCLERR
jgi:23S rRNA (uracil1939-C5)-methyltransferase